MKTEEALAIVQAMTDEQREAVAVFIEAAYWRHAKWQCIEDVRLEEVAAELRGLAEGDLCDE